MLLRVTVTNWDFGYQREGIRARLLEYGLAQNVELPGRPVVYGDFVLVEDTLAFLNNVKLIREEFSCSATVEVG